MFNTILPKKIRYINIFWLKKNETKKNLLNKKGLNKNI